VTQELSPALGAGAGFDWYVDGRKSDRSTILDVNFIRVVGGDAQDKGDFAQPGKSVFESRYPFKSTFSFGARGPFPFRVLRDFSLSTRLYHDALSRGSLLKTELKYQPSMNWRMSLGADILGVQEGPPGDPISTDFFKQYQARDRVYGGLSYVF
jgi:hypothetical protein